MDQSGPLGSDQQVAVVSVGVSVSAPECLPQRVETIKIRKHAFDIFAVRSKHLLGDPAHVAGAGQRDRIQIISIPLHFDGIGFHQTAHVMDAILQFSFG